MAAVLLTVIVGAFLCNSCVMRGVLKREIANTPRDPVTGVVLGAEAVTLVPETGDDPGPSRACLLVHGFLGSRKDFADLGERLRSKGMTVRMMRLPGHGTTPVDFAWLPDGAMPGAVRQEYLNLREEFDRVYVVGFSMGGALATSLAAEEKPDRLVLVSPAYGVTYYWYYVLPPEWWNRMLGWLVPYVYKFETFYKVNDRSAIERVYSYRCVPTSGVKMLYRVGRQARSEKTLSAVTCPVLLVHSRGDEAACPKTAEKAFERIGSEDKEAIWYERSNHILLQDQEGAEAIERIVEFLTAPDAAQMP